MFVSVTRLRIRRWWFLPAFAIHAVRSRRQLKSSPGFVCGSLAPEPWFAFWTATVWTDEKSMKAFRNSGAHLKAMPRLSRLCDEASYVHWQQDDETIPTSAAMFERLRDTGKLSKVLHPSVAHSTGQKTGTAEPRSVGSFRPSRVSSDDSI